MKDQETSLIIGKILNESDQLEDKHIARILKMLILTEKKPLITEENSRVDEISNDILKSNEEISDDEFNNLLKNKLKKEKIEDIYSNENTRLWYCYCAYHGNIAFMTTYTTMARSRLRHRTTVVGPHAIRTWSDSA